MRSKDNRIISVNIRGQSPFGGYVHKGGDSGVVITLESTPSHYKMATRRGSWLGVHGENKGPKLWLWEEYSARILCNTIWPKISKIATATAASNQRRLDNVHLLGCGLSRAEARDKFRKSSRYRPGSKRHPGSDFKLRRRLVTNQLLSGPQQASVSYPRPLIVTSLSVSGRSSRPLLEDSQW